jgi:serine/threonine protein kinase
MGEVFRARDTKLGRDVALKVISGTIVHSPEDRARFEREARLLATLNHPGIATIYGLEDDAGIPVLVMELVEGETLDKRLNRGPLPVPQALEVGRQIAEGLEAAHGKGIVHRDLKPSNIKLTPEGKVKLLDFGLAKALEVESASASPGHCGLHEPGAGAWGEAGPEDGHLVLRVCALRGAHGQAGVSGPNPVRCDRRGLGAGARLEGSARNRPG